MTKFFRYDVKDKKQQLLRIRVILVNHCQFKAGGLPGLVFHKKFVHFGIEEPIQDE